jgi:UDP-glucose 4-epimerase
MNDRLPGALAGKRVLVTGASGFLCQHLCPRLQALGAEMHGTSRRARPAIASLRWWQTELTTTRNGESPFEAVDPASVYRLSAEVKGSPEPGMLLPTDRRLLTSTICLLVSVAHNHKLRLILVGSLEELDRPDAGASPTSPYSAAKTAASQYSRTGSRTYGAPVAVLRTFMGKGPGQPEWKLIPAILRSLFDNRPPQLSSGRHELDWIHVGDIADASAAEMAAGVEGRMLEIGSARLTTIRSLVGLLVAYSGRNEEPVFGARPEKADRPPRVADVAATTTFLGWNPTIELELGLHRTVDWCKTRWSSEIH